MANEAIKKVLANVAQNLTSEEKRQARDNIGAAAAGDVVTDAVRYSEQTPTVAEQAQARTNIGAVSGLEVNNAITQALEGLAHIAFTGSWSDLVNIPTNIVYDASYVHTDNNFTSTLKNKLDGIEAGAEVNVQSDWDQTNSSADDYIKNKPTNLVQDADYVHTDNNFTDSEKTKLAGIENGATKVLIPNNPSQPQPLTLDSYNLHFHWGSGLSCYTPTGGIPQLIVDPTITTKLAGIEAGAEVNVQSDWTQTDNTADDYIKNKPTNIVQDASYVHTDNNFTDTLKDKLDGIAAGAEVNVQSDWSQTNTSADDYIKNKPTNIVQDASYVHTDNNFTTTLKDKLDGIEAGAEVNDITDVQVNGVSVVTNKVANITIPASVTEVYYAEYGVATVSDISAAKTAGKLVYTLIPGTYYPTVAYLRETTRNGASANFASPSGDSGSFKIASVTSSGTWSNETLNLAKTSDLSPNKLVFVTISDTYATVNGYRTNGYEVILKYSSSGSDLFQYFRLSQYNPDGSMEFTCIRGGSGYVIAYKYTLNTSDQWTRTDTSVSQYTGVQIDGVGRNLHLNQNNYIQTNFPGGLWTADMAQDNIFKRFSDGGFNGAYYLAARYKTDGTYELGISYSGSGSSSNITFIGTETIIATDNSATVKQAAYIEETEYYTVSTRFGGNASTAFDPTRHKAIYYSGFGNIGPASDVKIAIWNDNGTVKIGMTCIEVGKVGSTN